MSIFASRFRPPPPAPLPGAGPPAGAPPLTPPQYAVQGKTFAELYGAGATGTGGRSKYDTLFGGMNLNTEQAANSVWQQSSAAWVDRRNGQKTFGFDPSVAMNSNPAQVSASNQGLAPTFNFGSLGMGVSGGSQYMIQPGGLKSPRQAQGGPNFSLQSVTTGQQLPSNVLAGAWAKNRQNSAAQARLGRPFQQARSWSQAG